MVCERVKKSLLNKKLMMVLDFRFFARFLLDISRVHKFFQLTTHTHTITCTVSTYVCVSMCDTQHYMFSISARTTERSVIFKDLLYVIWEKRNWNCIVTYLLYNMFTLRDVILCYCICMSLFLALPLNPKLDTNILTASILVFIEGHTYNIRTSKVWQQIIYHRTYNRNFVYH